MVLLLAEQFKPLMGFDSNGFCCKWFAGFRLWRIFEFALDEIKTVLFILTWDLYYFRN
jgi:hypothetical protein